MGEKGANIDLLFRNGLKDFEVLPPPGVWEGIKASSKTPAKPLLFYRIAAVITVLLSIGVLLFLLNREDSVQVPENSIALNIKASDPLIGHIPDVSHYSDPIQIVNGDKEISKAEEAGINFSGPVIFQNISSVPERISVYEDKSILLSEETFSGTLHTPDHSIESRSLEVRYSDLQLMPDKVRNNRWSIGAMASPTYYSQFSSGSDELSKQLSGAEQPLISYSGGVKFSYKISKRFSIQSGLYFSSLGQRVDGINSYGGFNEYNTSKGNSNFEVPTTSGTVQSSNPDVFLNSNASNRIVTAFTSDIFDPRKASLKYINNTLTQNFSYLELPVILRYKIIDKLIGVNIIGGLSYNLLVHNSVYTTLDGSKYEIGSTKGLNNLALSSSLGMGMEYNLSDKLSLNLEPTIRYYLNPFSVTTSTFIHPYSFGIFSGITYKF